MNPADFKGKDPLRVPGKEIIIVIVVIFSSLSFTLGFFVGKSTRDKRPDSVMQVPEQNPAPQPVEPTKKEDIALPGSQSALQPAENVPSPQPAPAPAAEMKSPDPAKAASKGALKGEANEQISEKATTKPGKRDIIYSVQVGALKNEAEAESLKARLEKKGYKAYMTISRNKKREKIYKVKTGEFRERKDAEVLSIKLRKAEGLNTFVTFKNE